MSKALPEILRSCDMDSKFRVVLENSFQEDVLVAESGFYLRDAHNVMIERGEKCEVLSVKLNLGVLEIPIQCDRWKPPRKQEKKTYFESEYERGILYICPVLSCLWDNFLKDFA